jgi:hypothetical protein
MQEDALSWSFAYPPLLDMCCSSEHHCPQAELSDGVGSADYEGAERIWGRLRYFYIEKTGVLRVPGLFFTLMNSRPGAPARMLPSTIRGISMARGTMPVTASVAALPAIIDARSTDAGRGRIRRTP